MCSNIRGPANAPSLVTWPTSTTGTSLLFGVNEQLPGAFANLRYAAGRGLERRQIDRLNRVDDHQAGLHRRDVRLNLFQVVFTQHEQCL